MKDTPIFTRVTRYVNIFQCSLQFNFIDKIEGNFISLKEFCLQIQNNSQFRHINDFSSDRKMFSGLILSQTPIQLYCNFQFSALPYLFMKVLTRHGDVAEKRLALLVENDSLDDSKLSQCGSSIYRVIYKPFCCLNIESYLILIT